jgi:hypothetical protein
MEDTTKALKLPIASDLQTLCAKDMPPISLAKIDAGMIEGSMPNVL